MTAILMTAPYGLRRSVARSLRVGAERCTRWFRVGDSASWPASGCVVAINAVRADARNAGEIVGNA
jgi:hypothetical protein